MPGSETGTRPKPGNFTAVTMVGTSTAVHTTAVNTTAGGATATPTVHLVNMATPTPPVVVPRYPGGVEEWKKEQTNVRRRLTIACNMVINYLSQSQGIFRHKLRKYLSAAELHMAEADQLNSQLEPESDEQAAVRQYESHLKYAGDFEVVKGAAEQYLLDHADDAESILTVESQSQPPPRVEDHDEEQARAFRERGAELMMRQMALDEEFLTHGRAHLQRVSPTSAPSAPLVQHVPQPRFNRQMAASLPDQVDARRLLPDPVAQQRFNLDRLQINERRQLATAPAATMRVQQPSPDPSSGNLIDLSPMRSMADQWRDQQRHLNASSTRVVIDDCPDSWIDLYRAGLEQPTARADFARHSTLSATLEIYNGESLRWFGWISMFHSLVHQSSRSPQEKLAILVAHLSEKCKKILYGSGGDEEAYKSALFRLKSNYGQRNVMQQILIQSLDQLVVPKNTSSEFCEFAEKVRGHLLDLTRIGETAHAHIIEKIVYRLRFLDQAAWNEGKGGNLERRSLIEFGDWLVDRAVIYRNPYAIAAEELKGSSGSGGGQTRLSSNSNGQQRKYGRTNHGSATRGGRGGSRSTGNNKSNNNDSRGGASKPPFCYNCDAEGHWISDCNLFKELSVEERMAFATRHKLCHLCLGVKHMSSQCSRKYLACKVDGCKVLHHHLLHPAEKAPTIKAITSSARTRQSQVALGVIHAEAYDADGHLVPITVLFDECSTATLIRAGLARRLGLRGTAQHLEIEGVGATSTKIPQSSFVKLELKTCKGQRVSLAGSTMPVVTKPVPLTDWNALKSKWDYLADLPLPSRSGGQIDVLLGLDYCHLMAVHESRHGRQFQPIASLTSLGWVVRGVVGGDAGPVTRTFSAFTAHALTDARPDLEAALRLQFDTESFGTEFQGACQSAENKKAIAALDAGTRKLEEGYEAPILWKEGEPSLPDNRIMVENRLRSLINKFTRDPAYEDQYRAAVQKLFEAGYAVRVPEAGSTGPAYYLPHFGVPKAGSDEIRVVFDGAAKFRGKSLNDAISSGPRLQNNLADVVNKFREGEVAWVADVKAMFNRIRLPEKDRRFHRFLWPEDDGKISTCEMTRVTFGVTCSPFVAIRTINRAAEDAGLEENDAVVAVRDNFFVDDYLGSAKTVEEGVKIATRVDNVLKGGDFHLQEFTSNSDAFRHAVRPSSRPAESDQSIGVSDSESVLGLIWKPRSDTMGFKVTNLDDVIYTRAGLISKWASTFDPMGSAAPITVKGKIRLRSLNNYGLKWTDSVQGEEKEWWQRWFSTLGQLKHVEFQRCLFKEEDQIERIDLHTFCDASEEAYSAVVYVRVAYGDGRVVVRHVRASTKLAPTKTISIPKLELDAALLGARLATSVQKSLTRSVAARFFWTDSSTVRNWIRATASSYQTFVSHRIGEIQTLTEQREWRFCPGKLNPADAATRSQLEAEVLPYFWLDGPDFLYEVESCWPADLPWAAVEEERRAVRVNHTDASKVPFDWSAVELEPDDIPLFVRFEGDHLKNMARAQQEAFADDIERIRRRKALRQSSKLANLSPIIGTDGLLRLGGRADNARLPYDTLHPPILPGWHPLARKLIYAFHCRLNHLGSELVLSHVKQHVWLIGGKEAVKKVHHDCLRCRRYRVKPGIQLMGKLPDSRLDFGAKPFTRTAVDLFGPMETCNGRNRITKRWGVVFTCMVTRAVHVDLVQSLSTEDFLLVLRRFVPIYSPKKVHSDNGTNFVGAERELRDDVQRLNQSGEVRDFLKTEDIEWSFQPPATPHFGGTHEAMVKQTKRALYAALEIERQALRHPTDEVMRTLLVEVAGLLNTRPLYPIGEDPTNRLALTPNDFLNRSATPAVPAGDFKTALPKDGYRYLQRCLNLFWDKWKGPYLQSIIARQKWQQPQPNFAVGDIVLEADKNLHRGQWRMGKVVEVFPGKDALVRVVDVDFNGTLYRRGIQRLCLLRNSSAGNVAPASGEDVTAKA